MFHAPVSNLASSAHSFGQFVAECRRQGVRVGGYLQKKRAFNFFVGKLYFHQESFFFVAGALY